MSIRTSNALAAAAAIVSVLIAVSPAWAGTVTLGPEWEVTWDDSLDPYVDINLDLVTNDALYIEKSAEFIQGPGLGGVFPTIPIVFRQTAPTDITRIVIRDEIITNSTGTDWTDFHFDLMDGGDALFYDGPDFFFTTSPLNNQHFSQDRQSFWVDGFGLGQGGSNAVVQAGSIWYPGSGATNGDLIIEVAPNDQAPFLVFTLKETPTPEPGSLSLLLLGSLAVMRRNRAATVRERTMRRHGSADPVSQTH